MDSLGKLFKQFPGTMAPLLEKYYELEKADFIDLPRESLQSDQLTELGHLHAMHLDFYREERKMHFGAFALAGLAFVILLPALLAADQALLPLLCAETLLLALLVPYTFVYMRYEEGVRRKMRQAMIIENARLSTLRSSTNSNQDLK